MVVDIGRKMTELVPLLRGGLNGVRLPEVRPEPGMNWSADYAIVDRAYWDEPFVSEYFDDEAFRYDLAEFVKSHFSGDEPVVVFRGQTSGGAGLEAPAVVVRFYDGSQEIEVMRLKGGGHG